jgi:putative ABC transport system ATP-binding protein
VFFLAITKADDSFIELKMAIKKYGEGEGLVYALNEASLTLPAGEICVVLGPSGSGKSTLLNMIGGLDKLDSGELTIGGRKITGLGQNALTEYRRADVGFVFQFYNLIPDLTVAENIEVVSDIAKDPLDVNELLRALEIEMLQYRFPRELSGGQQQRVAIARAMVKNPKLLLCDELTGALDTASSREVLKLVERINSIYKTTVLIITHNPAIAEMADRVIHVKDGKISECFVNPRKTKAEALDF